MGLLNQRAFPLIGKHCFHRAFQNLLRNGAGLYGQKIALLIHKNRSGQAVNIVVCGRGKIGVKKDVHFPAVFLHQGLGAFLGFPLPVGHVYH